MKKEGTNQPFPWNWIHSCLLMCFSKVWRGSICSQLCWILFIFPVSSRNRNNHFSFSLFTRLRRLSASDFLTMLNFTETIIMLYISYSLVEKNIGNWNKNLREGFLPWLSTLHTVLPDFVIQTSIAHVLETLSTSTWSHCLCFKESME